jgi:hypothetical protein
VAVAPEMARRDRVSCQGPPLSRSVDLSGAAIRGSRASVLPGLSWRLWVSRSPRY